MGQVGEGAFDGKHPGYLTDLCFVPLEPRVLPGTANCQTFDPGSLKKFVEKVHHFI